MTGLQVLYEMLQELRAKWPLALAGAIIGGTTMLLLSETIRWYLGKGFFK